MATGLLESMDYKGGGLLERTYCNAINKDINIVIDNDIHDYYNYIHYFAYPNILHIRTFCISEHPPVPMCSDMRGSTVYK